MYGPETYSAQELHSQKYRGDGESFDDYCVRYARSLADDKAHFRHLLDGLRHQRILPGGRQQLAVGRPFQTTAYNCLRGDTEILTRPGFFRLDKLAGRAVEVLSPVTGRFEPAVVKGYGEQTLNRVVISTTFRDQGETFTVYATSGHRWVLQDGTVTEELRPGQVLAAGGGTIEPSPLGFLHGFVFGDGSRTATPETFQVRVCGEKRQHLARLRESGAVVSVSSPPSCGGDPFLRVRSGRDLKALPVDEDAAYRAGFVLGYLAADGCYKASPHIIHSTDRAAVEWVRDEMCLAGLAPVGGIKVETKPSNFGERQPLYYTLFRPVEEHNGFRVLAIDYAVARETVYCAEEPKGRQFMLRRGLRTGNCFTGGIIPDSMAGIMAELTDSAMTLRTGGGCGWDFSTIRYEQSPIFGLGPGAKASGPVGFMPLWHSMCGTIMSAGMRRGAMMGVVRVDHPDILKFIRAKRVPQDMQPLWDAVAGLPDGPGKEAALGCLQRTLPLTNFNVSVGITDKFMEAVHGDKLYDLRFEGRTLQRVRALDVWAVIMENNWDWAEPGVLFLDRINRMNPLSYAETIYCTNPCVPAGTLVSTPRGLVPVERLAEGSEITTLAGSGRVKAVEVNEDCEVWEVLLSDGTRVEATPGHIFHTCRGETKRWDVESRLREVRVGDKVRLAPGQTPDNPLPRKLLGLSDRDAGFLIGVVMGDGCHTEATAQLKISVGWHETDWHIALCNFFDRTGIHYRVDDHEKNTARVIILTKEIKGAVAEFGFPTGYANQKSLPLALVNSNADFLEGFLDGYVSTDGNVHMSHKNPMVRISTSSREAALSAQRVLHLMGMHARVYALKRGRRVIAGRELKGGPSWQVTLLGSNLQTLFNRVKITHPEKGARLRTLSLEYRLSGETWAATVKSIRPVGRKRVYDLYEPVTDTWLTEGAVSRGCGEQPLPPHGACLLGSLNLVKYLVPSYMRLNPEVPRRSTVGTNGAANGHANGSRYVSGWEIDYDLFRADVRATVRAFDNVVNVSTYPLPQHEKEAKAKRRMGLGVTAVANALEVCGHPYGSAAYLEAQDRLLATLRDEAYRASIELAREKGTFPLFDADRWLDSGYGRTLPDDLRSEIKRYGLRNGLLLSIAPTGTISLTADNVSSGIEPVGYHEGTRFINTVDGRQEVPLVDYAFARYGVRGRLACDVSPRQHIQVLCAAQKFIDSAVSKTCNYKGARGGADPEDGAITFDEFKGLYLEADAGGAKGCTTYNQNGKRAGILKAKKPEAAPGPSPETLAGLVDGDTVHGLTRQELAAAPDGSACTIDPHTGVRSCE